MIKIRLIAIFLITCVFIKTRTIVLVSLGHCCTVATVMRQLELRKAAYPFDWMLSNFNAVFSCFKDDFQNFLQPETLGLSQDKKRIINAYGNEFVHDFPTIKHEVSLSESDMHVWNEIRTDWRSFIPHIQEKYNKRIMRLREICKGDDLVFFIRLSIKRDEAIKLRDLIKHKYPTLKFILVAVNFKDGILALWDLPNIKNYYITVDAHSQWPDWKTIFANLQIDQKMVKDQRDNNELVCNGDCSHLYRLKDLSC